ncbi:alcohol dehydrogenase GroES domain-containing protein [Hypoxylon trugodes]|uniref:alcohol dehydrogenase GroES domain-containing protein n=1 Tax=Hypoxylon trugodes TaxID=326681 RepID=UPI00219CEDCA|nr:alcohol dehydrogenase GroES domain-containing protein [Hypoxylon trugodes]KAI1387168.1 alcohol dehydrogenase GroES domain-containing protein [Hypoxylon trugodes]
MASQPAQLPSTYKALQYPSSTAPPIIVTLPTPAVDSGSVIIKPLYNWIVTYAANVYGKGNPRQAPVTFPIIGGSNVIGRIAAIPPDATTLKIGDLVTVDPQIKARDITYLPVLGHLGLTYPGTWAELVKVPLENVLRFNEDRLKGLGVGIRDLAFVQQCLVGYGGLRDVNLTAGETVLVTPATGNFGGGAVHVALAMGARVIAMGRNEGILEELKGLAPGRVETVVMSGSVESDVAAITKFGVIDVFLDLTGIEATSTAHIRAGILSVRPGGRVSLMGQVAGVELPYTMVMYRQLTIRGTLMYTREQAEDLIKLVETGVLKLGPSAGQTIRGIYKLEDGAAAVEASRREAGAGRCVYIVSDEEYLAYNGS